MRMSVSVSSEFRGSYGDYIIRIYIVNETTRKGRDYRFVANKSLTKLDCIECEDGENLYLARDAAVKHMNELRDIKNEYKLWHKIKVAIKTYFTIRNIERKKKHLQKLTLKKNSKIKNKEQKNEKERNETT